MDAILRNVRFAFRVLNKHRGSTAFAVIAMGLGIGLVTAMFGIIDSIFLRGLPFPESHRVVHIERNHLARDIDSMEVTHHDFEDWQAQQKSFEGLSGFTSGTVNLSGDHLPDRVSGSWISTNFLEMLRVDPILGRGFSPLDAAPGAAPVILIGHHVWQNRYGGDPAVVGGEIRANGTPTTVIGVLPEGFRFPVSEDVWLPLELETKDVVRGEGNTLEVFGRLGEGVSLERAAGEMSLIARRLAESYPETNEGIGTSVKPYVNEFIGEETRQLLGVMFTAVLLVLVIACINVANLLIGRAVVRSRELAIRSALGSGRWRTIAQVMTEAALIAAAGSLLGIGLAQVGLRAFDAHISQVDIPFWFDFSLDLRVLGVALAAAALAALLAGLIPALRASRADVNSVLQDTGRGGTSVRLGRLSRGLVIAEVAFSCGLLIAAGLTVRSILASKAYDLQFDPSGILTARVGLSEETYPEDADRLRFFEELHRRVAERAEVTSATVATVVPTETEIGAGMIRYERAGETYEDTRDMPLVRHTVVTPGYFETFGVSLRAGRDFTAADREGSTAVAIVNEDFAAKEWPGQDPIGQWVDRWQGTEAEAEDPDAGRVQVIGIVPNLRFADFDNEDDQQGLYVPLAQNPRRFAWIVAKTRTHPAGFTEALRRIVLNLDRDTPLYFVRTMDEVLEMTMFYNNLIAILFSIFGLVSLVLSAIGLYGVMAFAVSRRTQEMGVRVAFGASGRDLVNMVVRQGILQASAGVVVGLLIGAGMSLVLATFLFQINPQDPITFAGVPLFLIAIAVLASLLPARRAAAVDPLHALRYE